MPNMKNRAVLYGLGLMLICSSSHAAPMDNTTAWLGQEWAMINYHMSDRVQQEEAISALAAESARVSKDNPYAAEPLIWQANILCTKANLERDASAPDEIEEARDLLLRAEKIDPRALNGSAYPLLGWIYHKVPSWPIGFGNDGQAEQYFDKAMALNPNSINTSFYYGNFLYEKGDYAQARRVLERGLAVPIHSPTALADRGRQGEIRDLLKKVNQKLL
jgi:tetratricopeptide (TPR) repeat protein